MNKWILIGNLVKDPQLFFTDSGTAVCSFTIACESGYGKYKKTIYPQVATFGKKAEAHAKNLTKGAKVAVVGEGYQDKNESKGKTYYNLKVNAKQVDYISKVNKDRPDTKDSEEYTPPALDEEFEGDMPF